MQKENEENKQTEKAKTSLILNQKIWEDWKVYCIRNRIGIAEKLEEIILREMEDNPIS